MLGNPSEKEPAGAMVVRCESEHCQKEIFSYYFRYESVEVLVCPITDLLQM
jgi:hypothetical protein